VPINYSTLGKKPAPPKTDDSLFWKAMEIVNRPGSAAFGVVTGLQEGDDPLDRAKKALSGEAEYSGKDVLKNFGVDPESNMGKYGGFALDVLNPLDPLNYVGGLGGLTKAGRAARLVGEGVDSWGDAARAGERGLVNFAGRRVPIPGDAAVLDTMQKAGNAFAGSSVGQGLQYLFGGKRGAVSAQAGVAGIPDEAVRTAFSIEDEAARIGNKFQLDTTDELKALESLRGDDRANLLESIGRMYRGDVPAADAVAQYVGVGAGADARRAAWDAADAFMRKQKEFISPLEGTGMDAYALPVAGHFPRLPKVKPGQDAPALGEKLFEEQWDALTGPSKNAFNRLLLPGSVEPVAVATLTDAGKTEYFRLGKKYFDEAQKNDPAFVSEFLRKHRKTPGELNATERAAFEYETNPGVVFKKLRDDAIANMRGDVLVRSLQKQGLAEPWDDAKHLVHDDTGRLLYAKVDQGRYASEPLAVPNDYARALQKMQEVLQPGPDKATFGAMINDALPHMLKDAGLMQWWKAMTIFGGGPSYFSRNFFTGVTKNYYEGLGLGNALTPRYYAAGFDTIGRALRGKWGEDAYVTLRNGTKLSKQRLYQEYMIRQMHGGGSPDVDIVEAGAGPSKVWRERIFRPAHKINEQVEMSIRLPLAIKMIDDTMAEAQKRGIAVPEVIGALAQNEQGVVGTAEDIVERAFKNAERQVKLSHFDYTDLSPFEEGLRRTVVPFYCVPTDHEILTQQGWKKHDALKKGEKVMAYDVKTGELRWESLIDVATFDFDGELRRFGICNDRHEFLFTDDHRWPVEVIRTKVKGKWYGGDRKIVRSYELNTSHKIPLSGNYTRKKSVLSPRLAAILGWVVTDGYHRWRKKTYCEMVVYQSPNKHMGELCLLLGTKDRAPHPATGVVCIPVALADVKAITKVFKCKEDMPRIVSQLSRKAAEAMYDAMLKAEGSHHARAGTHFAQTEGPVLEAFQILCLLVGKHANISGSGCYVQKVKYFAPRNSSGEQRRKYKGKIWCPKTPSGTWVMRHGGATIITGNTWMRKNIPSETINMLQRPGQYMPYVRAYYQAFQQAGISPADLPEWLASTFAVPIGETEDGRRKVLDMTGFLPFLDVVEATNAVVGEPRTGEGRLATIGRYLGTRANPFVGEFYEQTFQKEMLTGRDFGDLPKEQFGTALSPQAAGMINLFRPARELDRLNPGDIFTKVGNATGQFEGDVRPRRNEPGQGERWGRFLTGVKFYGADPDQANLSRNERAKKAKRYKSMAKKARREGRDGEAAYLEKEAASLEGT